MQRFETRPGNEVAVEVAWTLRRYGGNAQGGNAPAAAPGTGPDSNAGIAGNAAGNRGSQVKSGRSSAQQPVGAGNFDAIAAAHSQALATVSRDIAAAIRTSSSAQTSR